MPGHALRFHKIGRDKSGKCDALYTGEANDVVHGVMFKLQGDERAALDEAEDLGDGYERIEQDVQTTNGVREVMLYRAMPHRIDPTLRPFDWYHAYVLHGAKEHHLPGWYVELIEAVNPVPDPDPVRAEAALRLLVEWKHAASGQP